MGLGPPVCKKCMIIMLHNPVKRPAWTCDKCGINAFDNSEDTSNIFCYSKEEAEEILKQTKEYRTKK